MYNKINTTVASMHKKGLPVDLAWTKGGADGHDAFIAYAETLMPEEQKAKYKNPWGLYDFRVDLVTPGQGLVRGNIKISPRVFHDFSIPDAGSGGGGGGGGTGAGGDSQTLAAPVQPAPPLPPASELGHDAVSALSASALVRESVHDNLQYPTMSEVARGSRRPDGELSRDYTRHDHGECNGRELAMDTQYETSRAIPRDRAEALVAAMRRMYNAEDSRRIAEEMAPMFLSAEARTGAVAAKEGIPDRELRIRCMGKYRHMRGQEIIDVDPHKTNAFIMIAASTSADLVVRRRAWRGIFDKCQVAACRLLVSVGTHCYIHRNYRWGTVQDADGVGEKGQEGKEEEMMQTQGNNVTKTTKKPTAATTTIRAQRKPSAKKRGVAAAALNDDRRRRRLREHHVDEGAGDAAEAVVSRRKPVGRHAEDDIDDSDEDEDGMEEEEEE